MKIIRKLFLFFIALTFPWALMLKNDNPGAAIAAIVMQITLVGWPFATFWALNTEFKNSDKKKKK